MTAVALRPARPADSEFCYQLHKAAMGDYVAAIWTSSSSVITTLARSSRTAGRSSPPTGLTPGC